MKNWYDQIEKPIKDLVRLLRNHGFNTTCSCGHLPNPYIQLSWFENSDIQHLYELLVENDYKNFEIRAFWSNINLTQTNKYKRFIEIKFHPERRLASLTDIRK